MSVLVVQSKCLIVIFMSNFNNVQWIVRPCKIHSTKEYVVNIEPNQNTLLKKEWCERIKSILSARLLFNVWSLNETNNYNNKRVFVKVYPFVFQEDYPTVISHIFFLRLSLFLVLQQDTVCARAAYEYTDNFL